MSHLVTYSNIYYIYKLLRIVEIRDCHYNGSTSYLNFLFESRYGVSLQSLFMLSSCTNNDIEILALVYLVLAFQ